jgi:hypothetical protein
VSFCFDVRFRVSRPIKPLWFDATIKVRSFEQPLRFSRPTGTARDENWLAIESCGYGTREEAECAAVRVQDSLLLGVAQVGVGVEFTGRGSVPSVATFAAGKLEIVHPGLPLPTPLEQQELINLVNDALERAPILTANQRVAVELLNDTFFPMSPEAKFILRISAMEALCPQAEQTEVFKALVEQVITAIPSEAENEDREQIQTALKRKAKRQSVRSAYMSKLRQLLSREKAKQFDELYGLRSNLLHNGMGRGRLGAAADDALELAWELLLAEMGSRRPAIA